MKNYILSLVIFTIFLSLNLEAKDSTHFFPIDSALTQHQSALDYPHIKLYFATAPTEKVFGDIGTFTSNKTTNARRKPPRQSCDWVFISAIKSLQQRAVKEGGDAVVNIHSYYNKIEKFDEELYECHDGKNVSRVVLRGTVVVFEK